MTGQVEFLETSQNNLFRLILLVEVRSQPMISSSHMSSNGVTDKTRGWVNLLLWMEKVFMFQKVSTS